MEYITDVCDPIGDELKREMVKRATLKLTGGSMGKYRRSLWCLPGVVVGDHVCLIDPVDRMWVFRKAKMGDAPIALVISIDPNLVYHSNQYGLDLVNIVAQASQEWDHKPWTLYRNGLGR